MNLKTNWHFTKWNGYTVNSQCFKDFYGFEDSLPYISLEIGNKVKKILIQSIQFEWFLSETQKYYHVLGFLQMVIFTPFFR